MIDFMLCMVGNMNPKSNPVKKKEMYYSSEILLILFWVK